MFTSYMATLQHLAGGGMQSKFNDYSNGNDVPLCLSSSLFRREEEVML